MSCIGEDVLVNPLSEGPATAGAAVGFRIRRYERCAPFWPSLLSAGHAFRPLSALVAAPQDLSQPAEPCLLKMFMFWSARSAGPSIWLHQFNELVAKT